MNAGRAGLIGAPTYPMLRDATQATLFEILEANQLPYDYSKSENVLTLRDSRSRVLFRALDEFERLRGTNLAWFGLDELTYCPEEAWLRLEGRLRDPKAAKLTGFAVWTPKGFDWVYRRFMADAVAGYEVVLAPPFENRFLLDKIPDYYERLKSSYDERFYQQEVLGEYLNLNGALVYYAFRRTEHVRELTLDEWQPLFWALDFNVDPLCSVAAQITRGQIRVLDEIVLRHSGTEEACEEFQKRFPNHRAGVVVYGDASGNAEHTTGSSDYQIIRRYFHENYPARMTIRVPRANPGVRDRVTLANSKLRNAAGESQLLIDARCKELIKDFEQVSYKDDSNQIDKDRDRQRTHLSDALGYLLWQECRVREKAGERDRRLL